MPKKVSPLTDRQVMEAIAGERTRKLSDGGGLYVEISPSGTKTWRMKFVDQSGNESRMTFGNYPQMSLELARSRRSVVRKILKSGLDPRTEFDLAQVGTQTNTENFRRLPDYMDKTKLASCAALAGSDAVKRIEALAFPAFQRLGAKNLLLKNLVPLLDKIRIDRSLEVINLLYDICEEIASTCLDAGIDEDILVEAMRDSRVLQRRAS